MAVTKIIQYKDQYQATIDGEVLFVPFAVGNRHYQEIQQAIGDGVQVEQYVEPTVVPGKVSKIQFVRALRQTPYDSNGSVWDAVKALMPQMTTEQREDWELTIDIPRNYSDILLIAEQLDISSQQLDDIFILAATL